MNYENYLTKIIFHIFKFKTTEIIEILFVHFLKFHFMKFINKNSNAKDGQSFLAHGFLGDVVL